MPLRHKLRKYTVEYKLTESKEKINQLIYVDQIKLFAKNEKELETLYRLWEYPSGHREKTNDGRNRTNKQTKNQKARKKETYKYLRLLEVDTIKWVEMKEKNVKKHISREWETTGN